VVVINYGKGYQYAHDLEDKVADMDCLPDSLRGRKYYHGQEIGYEAEVKRHLDEAGRKRKSNKKK
jgi:putative ATPase